MGVDSDAETALAAWDRGELEVTKVEGAAPAVVAFQVQPTVGAVTLAFESSDGFVRCESFIATRLKTDDRWEMWGSFGGSWIADPGNLEIGTFLVLTRGSVGAFWLAAGVVGTKIARVAALDVSGVTITEMFPESWWALMWADDVAVVASLAAFDAEGNCLATRLLD